MSALAPIKRARCIVRVIDTNHIESLFLEIKRPMPRGSIEKSTRGPVDQLPDHGCRCYRSYFQFQNCCYYWRQSPQCWDQKPHLSDSVSPGPVFKEQGGHPEIRGGGTVDSPTNEAPQVFCASEVMVVPWPNIAGKSFLATL